MKGVLNDSRSPYYSRAFEIFLQGSYGNDTKVYADSDVDVAICTSAILYYDVDEMSAAD